MQKLTALNAREKKRFYKQLEVQFGHSEKFEAIILQNTKDKYYLLSEDYANLEVKDLRINNMALYFGKQESNAIRLSIEGAQILKAKKNIIQLTKEQAHSWMRGEDIAFQGNLGYVICQYKEDALGCGILKENVLRNMVPKERDRKSVV